jgi:hypothetical protein
MELASGTTLKADLKNQINVTLDCAVVKAGGTP